MANNTEATKNEAGNGEQKKPLEPLPQAATKQYIGPAPTARRSTTPPPRK